MTHYPLQSSTQKGFTLIELLVVVTVISISFSVMLMTISFGNIDDDIKEETKRLKHLVAFAHQQAIIEGREYGVYLTSKGYEFMALDTLKGLWGAIEKDKILKPRLLPEPLQLEFFVEESEVELDSEKAVYKKDETAPPLLPHVFLFSSGETYPAFMLQIRVAGESPVVNFTASETAEYKIVNDNEF